MLRGDRCRLILAPMRVGDALDLELSGPPFKGRVRPVGWCIK
jgi:hypothetical protein